MPNKLATRLLAVDSVATAAATTPGRGRGPSFIPSQEDDEVLNNQTNTRNGPLTRSKSKKRLHTAEKPDWALAPEEHADGNTRVTRSVSARTLNARGGGRRRPVDASLSKSGPDSQNALPLSMSRIVEVNGKWARGVPAGRGRESGRI